MANNFRHKDIGGELTRAEWEGEDTHEAASQAAGDIIYCDGTYWKRLGKGTDGLYLKCADAPYWEAMLAGDLVAHKNTHDPIDGSDKLDSAIPVKVAAANAIGSSHSFSRADHVHEREHAKTVDASELTAGTLPTARLAANIKILTITFIIDGGGSAITTGQKGHLEIPFACTINRVTMLADREGSIKVDIWKDDYAAFPPADGDTICGGNEPEISTGIKDQDSTLTAWTTAITAGDILAFNVDSITDIQRVTISLKVTKT